MPITGSGAWERNPATRIAFQGLLNSSQVNDAIDDVINGLNSRLPINGAQPMQGALTLFGDATAALNPVTYQQWQALFKNGAIFDAIPTGQATVIGATAKTIIFMGYATAGDGGQSLYKRVATEPVHLGKFRSADRFLPTGIVDNTNGGWWEIVPSDDRTLNVKQFGATGLNLVDETSFINNAIVCCKALGGGDVVIPEGQYRANGITPYNGVNLVGAGRGRSIIRVLSTAGIAQVAGTQLAYTSITGLGFKPHTAAANSATGAKFTCLQACDIDVAVTGFITGIGFELSSATVTVWDVTDPPMNGASSSFDNDIEIYSGNNLVGVRVQGLASASGGNANDANPPAAVTTLNRWRVWCWDILSRGIQIIGYNDSDQWHAKLEPGANSVVGLALGEMTGKIGQTYVNSSRFNLVFGADATFTSWTGILLASKYHGHHFDIEHDIDVSLGFWTPIIAGGGVSAGGYTVTGKSIFAGDVSGSGNLTTVYYGLNHRIMLNDGTAAKPSLSFLNDQQTGLRLVAVNKVAVVVGGVDVMFLERNALITLLSFPGGLTSAANDAAASAAGIPIGGLYHNAGAVRMRIT